MNYRSLTIFALTCLIFFSCKKSDTTPRVVTLPPVVTSKTYTEDEITGFHQLAFNLLREPIGGIIKLPKNGYYYITDTSDAYFVQQVDNVLEEINSLTNTNVVVKRTSDSADALVIIHFTDTTHFFAAVSGANEAYHSYNYILSGINLMKWNDSNLIYRDDIFIDKDSVKRDSLALLELTHHELMHSLGMLGHTNIDHFGSIMFIINLTPYVTDYTYFDKPMIQLLYNPAILPGMTQQQVDDVIANL